jgi:hypothetical protein
MKTNIIEHFQGKKIEIIDEFEYKLGSNDNQVNYMVEYFSGNYYSSKHGILVKDNKQILFSAIVLGSGGTTSVHEKSYLIEENTIFICCGNSLFSLTLLELKLNWKVKIDDATAFGIYKMNDDFIIHGELDISRINKNGRIIWQNGGSDIFTTMDGYDFEIIENDIFVKSWDGRNYKWDYNGKI